MVSCGEADEVLRNEHKHLPAMTPDVSHTGDTARKIDGLIRELQDRKQDCVVTIKVLAQYRRKLHQYNYKALNKKVERMIEELR